jgi:hypothetical protein
MLQLLEAAPKSRLIYVGFLNRSVVILNQIINSKNKVIQSAENGGKLIFDKTTGRGFGVSREGLFNGFRELPKQ